MLPACEKPCARCIDAGKYEARAPILHTLRQRVPLFVTLAALFIMGYPIALLFGLPLAQRDMQDLRKWQRDTFAAAPLAQIPDNDTDTLQFTEGLTSPALLTFADAPVSTDYRLTDSQLVLEQPLSPSNVVRWQGVLEPQEEGIYAFNSAPDNSAPDNSAPQTRARKCISTARTCEQAVLKPTKFPTDNARCSRFLCRMPTWDGCSLMTK